MTDKINLAFVHETNHPGHLSPGSPTPGHGPTWPRSHHDDRILNGRRIGDIATEELIPLLRAAGVNTNPEPGTQLGRQACLDLWAAKLPK